MRLTVKLDLSNMADFVTADRINRRVREELSLVVRDGLKKTEARHKRHYFVGGGALSRATHPTKITRRTGNLMRSYDRFWNRGNIYGGYGSPLTRARAIEEGAHITPKTVNRLAIPTEHATLGVGGAVWPRFYPKGELYEPKPKGKLSNILVSNKTGQIMFNLVDSVTIPPRPTLEKTADDMTPIIEAMVRLRVGRIVSDPDAKPG